MHTNFKNLNCFSAVVILKMAAYFRLEATSARNAPTEISNDCRRNFQASKQYYSILGARSLARGLEFSIRISNLVPTIDLALPQWQEKNSRRVTYTCEEEMAAPSLVKPRTKNPFQSHENKLESREK